MVAAHIRPWRGSGIRHIPAGSPYGVLDTRFAARSGANRWNLRGDPTLYLASDRAVALAEFARHFHDHADPSLGPVAAERAVYRLTFGLAAALDLRDPGVLRALGLRGGVDRFLDMGVAQATATFVRRTSSTEALLVPSMAFLDDADRWNMVLFLDKLPALDRFVTVEREGTFRVE